VEYSKVGIPFFLFRSSVFFYLRSRDSSVGIATDYMLDRRVSIPSRDKRFFSTASRPTLGPIQPPAQWVPGG
jgi:hypothetical protein